MKEESSADIAVELTEAFILAQVGVPDPDDMIQVELSRQVASHPPVSEVHKHYIHLLQVGERLRIDLLYDSLHFVDHLVDARLQISVVVLNVVNEFGQAPESVSLRCQELVDTQSSDIVKSHFKVL